MKASFRMTPPNGPVRTTVDSPLGPLLLATSAHGLVGVWFTDQRYRPSATEAWREDAEHPVLQEAAIQLARYFCGESAAFTLPMDLSIGTPFQQTVWSALLQIPSGLTENYSQVAQRIGRPTAARAVGTAIGRNPLSIVVPCHRVIGATGALTGYAGGLDRKAALLRLERGIGLLA